MKKKAILHESEIGTPGCGCGRCACYALNATPFNWQCLLAEDPDIALNLGRAKSWKVNRDPVDHKPWCPKGILPNSKWPN